MSTCAISANQPIYQALLDKAASYPADKTFQVTAYQKAADNVSKFTESIYDNLSHSLSKLAVGSRIRDFIIEFITTHPQPKPTTTDDDTKDVTDDGHCDFGTYTGAWYGWDDVYEYRPKRDNTLTVQDLINILQDIIREDPSAKDTRVTVADGGSMEDVAVVAVQDNAVVIGNM